MQKLKVETQSNATEGFIDTTMKSEVTTKQEIESQPVVKQKNKRRLNDDEDQKMKQVGKNAEDEEHMEDNDNEEDLIKEQKMRDFYKEVDEEQFF